MIILEASPQAALRASTIHYTQTKLGDWPTPLTGTPPAAIEVASMIAQASEMQGRVVDWVDYTSNEYGTAVVYRDGATFSAATATELYTNIATSVQPSPTWQQDTTYAMPARLAAIFGGAPVVMPTNGDATPAEATPPFWTRFVGTTELV